MQIISPLVLSVALRVLPVPVLILVAVRLLRLGLRLGDVAFADLVLASAAADDDHGGAVVARLRAGSARGRGGRRGGRRCRCSAVGVVLQREERLSLSRVLSAKLKSGVLIGKSGADARCIP